MKILVVGAGYVGLVSAVCVAVLGHTVSCLDTDAKKIKLLSKGESPIHEPGLEERLGRFLKNRQLQFSTDWKKPVENAEVVFLTVGTPMSRGGNGYADLSYVFKAARSLAPHLKRYTVIVNKSTVQVGTARRLQRIILGANPKAFFDIVSNPEFLRQGDAIYDFMKPDRVILGSGAKRAEKILRQVYFPLIQAGVPFFVTTPEVAELVKYASNAFLATKISFMNEIACLCEKVGADVQAVAQGMGLDPRIGSSFLQAGPGYGGSCFPKDTVALLRTAQEHGAPFRILETVVEVNHAQKARMVAKILNGLGSNPEGKTLAVLGLTFKPKTDDLRDSPASAILPILMEKGIEIRAYDPVGMANARRIFPDIKFFKDPYLTCKGANGVCLMTEWEDFLNLDLARLKGLLREPIFIDLRNAYSLELMREAGFAYFSVGRPAIESPEQGRGLARGVVSSAKVS